VKADRESQPPIDELQTISVIRLYGEGSHAVEDLAHPKTSANRNKAKFDEFRIETATYNGEHKEKSKGRVPENAGKAWSERDASESEVVVKSEQFPSIAELQQLTLMKLRKSSSSS
ncbi:hypothetical protein BDK51DRAFT_34821, partial [Blyttiomyces helicus]